MPMSFRCLSMIWLLYPCFISVYAKISFLHWTLILWKFTKNELVKNVPTSNFNFRTAKLPSYFFEAKQVLNNNMKIVGHSFFIHLVSFVKVMNHDWVTRRLGFFYIWYEPINLWTAMKLTSRKGFYSNVKKIVMTVIVIKKG